MSKIGKMPVQIPSGVKVDLKGKTITVTGPKGTLDWTCHEDITVTQAENTLVVTRPSDQRQHRALHGLTRALIQNMVTGVADGYVITLTLVGVGYRAELTGKLLTLNLGYSHPIVMRAPDGVEFEVLPKESKILVKGINKELVGAMAAKIRAMRPPEPFKGKGIRYENEQVRRKAGKTAGSGAA